MILTKLQEKIESMDEVKGLGFCTGVAHAQYMASQFNQAGIAAKALDGKTSRKIRRETPHQLRKGKIHFIFVADLYNEGIDIPEVNTILFLRPTESLTIFLQQLGRGLRLSPGKTHLTVFDFVGRAHKNYSFQEKFRALIGKTSRSLKEEIIQNFPHHPKGCYLNMERMAQQAVLACIKSSLNYKRHIVQKLQRFKQECRNVLTLPNFLQFYHINISIHFISEAMIFKKGKISLLEPTN